MSNSAIARMGKPIYLSTDHDPLFTYHRWHANLRILEIDEIKTVPGVPTSHPFVERSIGLCRQEFLDYMLLWNVKGLTRKLNQYQNYYNATRAHLSLSERIPNQKATNGDIPNNRVS